MNYLAISAAAADFINRVGFPIAVCIWFMYFYTRIMAKVNESMSAQAASLADISRTLAMITGAISQIGQVQVNLRSQGTAGPIGPIGAVGPIGAIGPQGPQGPQGLRGAAAAALLLFILYSGIANAQTFNGQVFNDGFASCANSNMRAGQTDSGRIDESQLTDPAAPAPAVVGSPGTTTYNFYLVGHDGAAACGSGNEGMSNPSSVGSVSNGPNVLTSSNYVSLTVPAQVNAGYAFYDVLLGNTSTVLQSCLAAGSTLNYTGQSTSGYTPPTRNSTGDMLAIQYLLREQAAAPPVPPNGGCVIYAVPGTNSGSCKIVAKCGTSNTPVTITDNIGSGC